ncbi:MAG: HesA/MoeB/ThiF family protein [Firmicutes bacterium]|nr:HesA/MoeB/ThiF family protein [Bacillota bacterium]
MGKAVKSKSTAGEVYYKLGLKETHQLAKAFKVSVKEVEIAALEEKTIPERYQRSMGITGIEGQKLLLQSRAVVVGAGGLGGLVIELLARMGIGTLIIVDGDTFSESNLNRQILCTENNLGESKAKVAAQRVRELNSAVEAIAYAERATEENLATILAGADVALDCLDNLPSRHLLQKECRRLGIPMIHGAIAQYMGQVLTIFPEDKGIETLYPDRNMERGVEVLLGNPAATPAMIAAWQVQEAVKILIGEKDLLRNRMLYFDMKNCRVNTISLA